MHYHTAVLFERVRRELEHEPRLSLAQLSSRLSVHRHTIEKAVQASASRTFRSMQQEILFRKACELLNADDARSIKEVAFSLGFGSTRAFGRFARRLSGQTPTQLRDSLYERRVSIG